MHPDRLGRYEILGELGRGAMGRVLLAHDPQIDRKVAIKIWQGYKSLPDGERAPARERFLREARAAGKLLHPGIVTVFDAGEADGELFLAMERVEGGTLDAACKPGSLLPVPVVAALVASAAEALAYAHRAGVVHRDIKPANLMRTSETSVKIMDFGLARAGEAGLAQDGALFGSPGYMSPEQIRGRALDGRSDLFSLGVVLFELLTGERPFPGDTVSAVIYRIVNEQPKPPSTAHARVDPRLDPIVARALAKDPAERFADGDEMARALREAVRAAAASEQPQSPDRAASGPVGETPPPPPRRPPRSSPWPWVAGLVVAIAALAAGAWLFRERIPWLAPGPAPPPPTFETSVRVEPPEASLELDGRPLDAGEAARLVFRPADGSRLVAALACRRVEHRLTEADAGAEVALVLEPTVLAWTLDLPVAGAAARVNGAEAGPLPVALELDLCRENTIQVEAAGFHPAAIDLEAGASPLDARRRLGEIELVAIPRGLVRLPDHEPKLVYHVDGERVSRDAREVELTEGVHRVRAVNEAHWIDVSAEVTVVAGEAVDPGLEVPALGTLSVLAFPPNAKVDLRRPGGSWAYLDEVPAKRRLAAGSYEVRVTLHTTGEARTQEVTLAPGRVAEIRISFGGSK